MSHISEGDLHAYLDGALDEYPSPEAERIRQHVEVCGECIARLEEERAVREEAAAILDGVLPRLDMPPLEELRARAAALGEPRVSETRSGRSVARLGWAASIMVALGAGYMLRGGGAVEAPVRGPEAATAVVASEVAETAPNAMVSEPSRRLDPAAPTEEGAADSERLETPATVQVAAAPQPSLDAALEGPSELDRVVTDMSGRVGLDDFGERVAFRTPVDPAPSSEGVPPAGSVLGPMVVTASRSASSPSASLVLADSVARDVASEEQTDRADVRLRALVVSASRSVPAGASGRQQEESEVSDEVLAEGRMGVPGLETLSITWIAEGVVAGGVSVHQALADGDTLTLLHLPQGVGPDEVPLELAEGERELVVPRGEGWLLLRAKRSFEELRVLLERLDSEDGSGF